MPKLIIGSRGSKLARWQTDWVKARLEQARPDLEFAVEIISTEGDTRHDLSPDAFGKEGIFTAELDHALTDRRIDLAVHSLKDLPTKLPPGLTIAAVTERAPIRDLFILRADRAQELGLAAGVGPEALEKLPAGTTVGTSSLRRIAQLLRRAPGLKFAALRGNLDTRIRKLGEGQMDALVVAEAGLTRLGLSTGDHLVIPLPVAEFLPAAGQGALAIETRADDPAVEIAKLLEHSPTRAAVTAERTAMAALGAGCRVPAGFLAEVKGGWLTIRGMVGHPGKPQILLAAADGHDADAEDIGRALAQNLIRQGAAEILREARSEKIETTTSFGKVYLAGSGPGDPGLLTLRARELIDRAEVILFDQLVGEPIREFFPESAEKIFVGKEGGTHYVTQDETIRLIVEKAKAGKTVLRLKGGDPYVFGRGGEEAEACAEAGIPFEVVPGITAGVAAAAYAGIPVTHRDASASLALITGHRRADGEGLEIPAPEADTLVYYMGIKNLPQVVEALVNSGRSLDTPVALVERGTTPRQRVATGTLSSIEAEGRRAGIKPPAIIVVGEVVKYREQLRWFDKRPLFGLTVLITRPRHQAREIRERLDDLGAAVISMPAIEIKGLEDFTDLDKAIDHLSSYHYLVFTSVNGVTEFFKRMREKGKDARALAGLTTACIGPRTADELKKMNVNCDLIPPKFVAESLLEIFPSEMKGKRVLIPRALEAREILPEGLTARGATVNVVPAYRTVGADDLTAVPENVDLAVFTSSSSVDHFLKRAKLPAGCRTACIGPITAATLREHGLNVDIESAEHTIPGLVDAVLKYYEANPVKEKR